MLSNTRFKSIVRFCSIHVNIVRYGLILLNATVIRSSSFIWYYLNVKIIVNSQFESKKHSKEKIKEIKGWLNPEEVYSWLWKSKMKWKCIIFYMITLQMGHLAQDAYFLKNLIRLYNFSDYSSEHILNYLVTTQFFFLIMSLARLSDFHSSYCWNRAVLFGFYCEHKSK